MNDFWQMKHHILLEPDGGAGDGGAGTGSGEGAAVVGTADDAPVMPTRKGRANPLEGVQYGTQAEAQQPQEAEQQAEETAPEQPQESWEEVKKRWQKEIDAEKNQVVRDRLKNAKYQEKTLDRLLPSLAQKFGVDPNDIDGIIARVEDDDSLYEQEALERGLSIETLKEIKALERENAAYKQTQQEEMAQHLFEQHIQNLAAQGEKVKAMFPNFDLRTELQNDTFRRLTSPEGGVDVMTAYKVVHAAEIEPQAMKVGSERTAEMIAAKIASGQRRPSEGGARSSAGVEVRSDPSKLKKADFEEIRRRVARGERISF